MSAIFYNRMLFSFSISMYVQMCNNVNENWNAIEIYQNEMENMCFLCVCVPGKIPALVGLKFSNNRNASAVMTLNCYSYVKFDEV